MGYKYVIFGHLNGSKERKLGLDITTQNLTPEFVQKFYSSSFLADPSFLGSDVMALSQTPNYKKRLIYKELMAEYGFNDFLISFILVDGLYLGYLIAFREEPYGVFKDIDFEIAENIRTGLLAMACQFVFYFRQNVIIKEHRKKLFIANA